MSSVVIHLIHAHPGIKGDNEICEKQKRGWNCFQPRLGSSVYQAGRPPRGRRITLIIHAAAHAAHAAAAMAAARCGLVLLGGIGDQALGGEQQTGDGRRVLQR